MLMSCWGTRDASTQVGEKDLDTSTPEDQTMTLELRELLSRYCTSSTIHGVAQTTDQGMYTYRRVVWLILVLGMAACLSLVFVQRVRYLNEYPIKSSTRAYFQEKTTFPSVTICNLNQFHMDRIPNNDLVKVLLFSMSEFAYLTSYGGNVTSKVMGDDVPDISGEELANISAEAAHRPSDMFIRCWWRSSEFECSDVMRPVLTSLGLCYNLGRNVSHLITQEGPHAGLRLVMNIESEKYYFSLTMQRGIKVIVHEPNQVANVDRGWLIRPGVSANVGLSREDNVGLPRPYKAYTDKYCFDAENEANPLRMFDTYSHYACVQECIVNTMAAKCGCRSFSSPGDSPFCTAKEMLRCYIPEFNNLQVDDVSQCQCPFECKQTKYVPLITYSNLSPGVPGYEDVYTQSSLPRQDYVRNMIDVRIFFQTVTGIEIRQDPEITLADMLGSFGGLMGLFLGASLLSVTELSETLLLMVYSCIKGCSKLKGKGISKMQGSSEQSLCVAESDVEGKKDSRRDGPTY